MMDVKVKASSLLPCSALLLLLLLLSSPLLATSQTDRSADRDALLALRSAVKGRWLLWNLSSPDTPCSWTGVVCQLQRVTELHLPGMGLSGQIPTGTIGNLTMLQTLSLRFNSLSGSIPPDFASLSNLTNLYLQENSFSGPIPSYFYSLTQLNRLNLANNDFSGEISKDVNKLTNLGTLFLENNHLTGHIPVLTLPGLQQFNVSNNNLTGSIPSRLSGMNASSFLGNSLCGGPLQACPKPHKLSGGAIAGIVIGCLVFALLILLLLFICCFRIKRNATTQQTKSVEAVPAKQTDDVEAPPVEESKTIGGGILGVGKKEKKGGDDLGKTLVFYGKTERNFNLEDLLRASAEVLGKGTFGTAYKAVLEMGIVVAVKRLKDVNVGEKEFRERMDIVGSMEHENLVMLKAYYYTKDEKLLVYNYLPMGSFSALLHGNRGAGRTPLNWETRSNIALGAARGIAYIHSNSPTSSHGNIKSSNILLSKSYEARVSDFGLAHLGGPAAAPNRIDGYRAPEVTDARKVSQKADVYSFGVLLLELLTGKAPTHAVLNEEGVDLPRWVQSVVREEWTSEVFDLELLRYQNVEEDMVQLLQLAIDCTAQYPDSRPSMADVVRRIEELCQHSSHIEPGDRINDSSVEIDGLAG